MAMNITIMSQAKTNKNSKIVMSGQFCIYKCFFVDERLLELALLHLVAFSLDNCMIMLLMIILFDI